LVAGKALKGLESDCPNSAVCSENENGSFIALVKDYD